MTRFLWHSGCPAAGRCPRDPYLEGTTNLTNRTNPKNRLVPGTPGFPGLFLSPFVGFVRFVVPFIFNNIPEPYPVIHDPLLMTFGCPAAGRCPREPYPCFLLACGAKKRTNQTADFDLYETYPLHFPRLGRHRLR